MKSYSEQLGYRRLAGGIQECEACGASFAPRPRGFAVEGPVLRSHRRRCPEAPAALPTPGVCDA